MITYPHFKEKRNPIERASSQDNDRFIPIISS